MRKLTRLAAEQAGGLPRVPVLDEHEERRRVGVVLVTGDRGLAGAFNTNVIREGVRLGDRVRGEGAETSFSVVGRKGVSALTFRKLDVRTSYVGFTDRPAFANAREIGEELTARYVEDDLDRVELIYNRYVSPLTQHVWRQTLLPLQQAEVIGEGAERGGSGAEETEAERAQSQLEWDYEPEPGGAAGPADPRVRDDLRLPGAARVRRLGARRADDRDAQRRGERGNDDGRPDPGDEPRPAGGNHPGDLRGRRRRRGAGLDPQT